MSTTEFGLYAISINNMIDILSTSYISLISSHTSFRKARWQIVNTQPGYRIPLYELIYVATDDVWRISTNGKYIFFNPDWLQKLKKESLEFMILHVLMHILLGHTERPTYYKGDRFHLSCDIVVNSTLGFLG